MKGFSRKIALFFIIAATFFTGCGEKLIELTDSETAVIANTASSLITKADQSQTTGLTNLPLEEESDTEEEEQKEEQEAAPESEPNEKPLQDTNDKTPVKQEAEKPTNIVTLSEAIGLTNIEAQYTNNEIKKSYGGSGYSLEANAGNTYLLLNITLTNTSSQPVSCNLLMDLLKYQININNKLKKEAQVTLMLNDLSTFVGTIEPSQSIATALIFELEESAVKDIQSMRLIVNRDGTEYIVDLKK